ncbi:class I SAM-dependent methyltransferase [Paenibacillus sp. ISL-20]|uniref:class I SAM-dependent methyltransferase n=1 Tax=Paenibacillus sp. ISL-20 TaxID=2819163 RepID=UPI001BE86390|nr:class I SAM-dependent methyltransferase [Paenibacillus sp. ISL-20]MBT2764363.1 class I SAM-dependent methyltransferase [Paenibacillus sp. ISL-20]
MNNNWNKIIYKIWSPIYDKIFNSNIFLHARKQIFQETPFNNTQKILFVGVGTGADLELLNHYDLDITAIDFSPDMLRKARAKFKNSRIKFLEMDAQNMAFNDMSFDYVVGSLILSVVPDADKCFQEIGRVLKQEGRIVIFDKFTPSNHKLSLSKKLFRPLIKVLGTDIGLNFEELYLRNRGNLIIEEDKPVMLNGMYRKIVLRKIS